MDNFFDAMHELGLQDKGPPTISYESLDEKFGGEHWKAAAREWAETGVMHFVRAVRFSREVYEHIPGLDETDS